MDGAKNIRSKQCWFLNTHTKIGAHLLHTQHHRTLHYDTYIPLPSSSSSRGIQESRNENIVVKIIIIHDYLKIVNVVIIMLAIISALQLDII